MLMKSYTDRTDCLIIREYSGNRNVMLPQPCPDWFSELRTKGAIV